MRRIVEKKLKISFQKTLTIAPQILPAIINPQNVQMDAAQLEKLKDALSRIQQNQQVSVCRNQQESCAGK